MQSMQIKRTLIATVEKAHVYPLFKTLHIPGTQRLVFFCFSDGFLACSQFLYENVLSLMYHLQIQIFNLLTSLME